MHTLFLTPLSTSPLKPELSFPPLKSNQRFHSISNSSSKLLHNEQTPCLRATQIGEFRSVLAPDYTSLFNDWPQLLQISLGSGDLLLGQSIHGFLQKLGHQVDPFRGNNLINLYSKFDRLEDAQKVFDEMPVRNTITWTSLMKGYSEIGDFDSVFIIAEEMLGSGEMFNEHTCSVMLQACCCCRGYFSVGAQIHGFVIKSGFLENVFVSTSLISMYSRNGLLGDAGVLFDSVSRKDVRCFNFMISEFGNAESKEKAFESFLELLVAGLVPNDFTFTSVISACNKVMGVKEGRQFHCLAIKFGFACKLTVGNAVISMYGTHGMLEEAEKMFHGMGERNLISWTALISGYVRNGCSHKAFGVFIEAIMCGIPVDTKCLAVVLDGCSECTNFELGCQIHGLAVKYCYDTDVSVGTALIDMYAKCRDVRCADLVFQGISTKTTASFNAVFGGYVGTDDNLEEVVTLCKQLSLHSMSPDSMTLSILLRLSADKACLSFGKSIHCYVIKIGLEATNTTVCNSLITMYARCGCIKDAKYTFKGIENHDLISWNAMISAYALHGQGGNAISLFEELKERKFAPDEVTILAVLQACNYSGLSEYGIRLFYSMEQQYNIKPVFEHYACMVDLFGRAAHFAEAVNLIKKSPFPDSPLLWRTLVHGCKLHEELKFGQIAATRLLELLPGESGSYVLVSNMYTGGGMLDEAGKVKMLMNDMNLRKDLGCSWIDINNGVHQFGANSKDHPESPNIYSKLDLLKAEMTWMRSSTNQFYMI